MTKIGQIETDRGADRVHRSEQGAADLSLTNVADARERLLDAWLRWSDGPASARPVERLHEHLNLSPNVDAEPLLQQWLEQAVPRLAVPAAPPHMVITPPGRATVPTRHDEPPHLPRIHIPVEEPQERSVPRVHMPSLPPRYLQPEQPYGEPQSAPERPSGQYPSLPPIPPEWRSPQSIPRLPAPARTPSDRPPAPYSGLPPIQPEWRPSGPRNERPQYPRPDAPRLPHIGPEGLGGSARVFEMRLAHRSSDHSGADAVVRVPANLDPNQPIHLVIFNHGMYDNAKSAYEHFNFAAQMANAPPNTVLIVPEWMASPPASRTFGYEGKNTAQGNFALPGVFRGMLQDVLQKVAGRTLDAVDSISIIGHSAGGSPTMTEMSHGNGLDSKVTSVTLLAALYSSATTNFFEQWVGNNREALMAGRKRFYNFYDPSTSGLSAWQAEYIRRLIPTGTPGVRLDPRSVSSVNAQDILGYSIIVQNASGIGHMNLPSTLLAPVERVAPR